ncbi:cytochrome c5 family protein [Lysobacter sp. H21R4]|uniref:c-type cytochrome n=1 Tax=Lysobacter sp. H21R4 TaxID=2781021 RepID=UPI001887C7C2|nr:c-type cytochrome [Lysobacter sp. H21R4]QOY62732.1 cytochrome c5 family protein [Lysobacter sp. H21R4]
MRNYDLDFLKRFSLVIGFLIVLSLGLVLGARMVSDSLPYDEPDNVAQRTRERIAPVGSVYAGGTGAAAAAAAASAAAASASAQVAYGGTLDGSVIFDGLCAGCHASGAGGAPTMDQAHWSARIAQGMDTLHKHAIEGYTGSAGLMPAKGGNPALTDEQVIATVDWMVENLK